MLTSELIASYPALYHMAEDGSWLSIKRHGLLSTSALLTLYGYSGPKRNEIECEYRPRKRTICCHDLEDAKIRDQKVMPPEDLKQCLLGGMTPQDWYELINGKIFFWAKYERLKWFLSAREYRNSPNVVITVDTRALLNGYAHRVTLTSFNTGSTLYSEPYTKPRPRGRDSFIGMKTYPVEAIDNIVEVVVEEGVPDIASLAVSVERWIAHKTGYEEPEYERLDTIWHK
jgi:hypothetical protein